MNPQTVETWMSCGVWSVSPASPVAEVLRIMQREKVHHVCVNVDGVLVGIVSDRDVKRALPSALMSTSSLEGYRHVVEDVTVGEIMTREPITVSPSMRIGDCAELMRSRGISAVPVVMGDHPVGIVTRSDCLAALNALTGAASPITA